MNRTATSFCACLLLALGAAGCFVDNTYPLDDSFGVCAEPPVGTVPDGMLTYYEHAKPIIDARCAYGCHVDDGIGPFPLSTHEDVFFVQDSVYDAIQADVMPPWQPDDCCNHYLYDRSLTADEKATLLAWIAQGLAMGDPADEGPPVEVERGELPRVDVVTTMAEPFTPEPLIGRDDLRCFLLDWPIERETYLTGLNVVPGDRTMVHHVVVAFVSDEVAEELRAREGEDGRPGWNCYGELGASFQAVNVVGGWAPGYQGVAFSEGLGKKVPAGSNVVLNMHYDTGRGIGSDQTSVEFMITDEPVQQMTGSAVANPLWLVGDGMSIPAHDPDVMTYFSWDPTALTQGDSFEIHSLNVHMHELGTIGRMAIMRADGTTECLLNITDWDFDWISDYYLRAPVTLHPGDQLFLECHWDNTAANQKIVDGELEEPRDIAWGTDQEMCAGVISGVRVSR